MNCPYCKHILPDQWLKKAGASLMGRSGGATKARGRAAAQEAAQARWDKARRKALREKRHAYYAAHPQKAAAHKAQLMELKEKARIEKEGGIYIPLILPGEAPSHF